MAETNTGQLVRGKLRQLVDELEDGARLPTVRELMRRFSVSQGTVQSALHELRESGKLSSQVGRGTFVVKTDQPQRLTKPRAEVVESAESDLMGYLMLSSSGLSGRSIIVQNGIYRALLDEGVDVVQMSYQDAGQLLRLLSTAPGFGAAILQSQYEVVPIRLLNLLKNKAGTIVADGHSISGLDIDVVGTDWTEAMDSALEHLTALGHRDIGLVTIASKAWPILAARRYFERAGNWRGTGLRVHPAMELRNVHNPSHSIIAPLKAAFAELKKKPGKLPFTALLCLGITDGAGLRDSFSDMGIAVPDDISVSVLGHCDVPSEHHHTFSIFGPTADETIAEIVNCIKERRKHPDSSPNIVYLPISHKLNCSTASLNERDR